MQVTLIEPRRNSKPQKGDDFPIPMLSGGAKSVRDVAGFWTVAHCRSHHEKTLALVAEDSGFGFFLPLENKRVKKTHGEYLNRQVPFEELDGYVFLSSTTPLDPGYPIPIDLHDFLEDQFSFFGIIEVRPSQQQRFIADLDRLHGEALKGRHKAVVKGKRCRVMRGPYMGMEGLIESESGKGYVRITVDAIKSMSMFEIPATDLEAI